MKKIFLILHSTLFILTSVVAQTTNNPGVPIFGAGGTTSGLQFVFVNGLGNVAYPANFAAQNASSIVASGGATNGIGSHVAFVSDISALTALTITNGSSTATIQAVFNSNTNNSLINIQPGDYNLGAAILVTNGGYINGNSATFHWTNTTALLLAGFMFDTGTNLGKRITIDSLGLDGGVYVQYNTSSYYDSAHLLPNGFYGDLFWSNRTGLRIEASGGALVKNCNFTGWSGNALLALNDGDNGNSLHLGRLTISENRFSTNFAGIFLPGSAFETPGFNNSGSSSWNDIEPDYTLIIGNQIDGCQNGIVDDCPNDVVENNAVLNSYFGIIENALGGNALVLGNNLNHNTICGIYVGAGNGFPAWIGNTFIAPITASFVADSGNAITFEHNFVSGPLIFTNNSTGTIIANRLFPADPWGSGQVTTNIDSGMIVAGNFSQDGTQNDYTALSYVESANSAVFIRTNAPILSLIPTNGFTDWWSNSISTNNFYRTVNNNGAAVTYHQIFQP